MVQQDNKPNLETTVDGKPLFPQKVGVASGSPPTHEYVQGTERDDDPLLTREERANTRADVLGDDADDEYEVEGPAHP